MVGTRCPVVGRERPAREVGRPDTISPMYAIAIVRYRRPIEQVLEVQEPHRAYLRDLQAEGTLLAAGPQEPRFGGVFLLRVPDDNPQAALDAIRDNDPYYQAGVAQYELIRWNVVIGKEDLDGLV